jgi:hypothetical protein
VSGQTTIQIDRQPHVGSISVFAGTPENVHEAFHSAVLRTSPGKLEATDYGES